MWFSGWAFSVGPRNEDREAQVNTVYVGLCQSCSFVQNSISSAAIMLPLQSMAIRAEYLKPIILRSN